MASLLQRGVKMLFMYTDGYQDICGKKQFQEMFAIEPNEQLQFEYFDKSEHTFRLTENFSRHGPGHLAPGRFRIYPICADRVKGEIRLGQLEPP